MKYIVLGWDRDRWIALDWSTNKRDAEKDFKSRLGEYEEVRLIKVEEIERWVG